MQTPRFFLAALAGLIFAGLVLLAQAAPAHAAPAAPGEAPLTQPDGTVFTARAWGDERMRGWETLDGYTVVFDERSGYWVYAAARGGVLSPALSSAARTLAVGHASPAGLEKHARPALPAAPASPAAAGALLSGSHGVQPLLVVLVSFNTLEMIYPAASFQNLVFGLSAGSVRHFFRQASLWSDSPLTGLDLIPAQESQGTANDGVVAVKLGGARPDYVEAYYYSNEVASAALAEANQYVNFQPYDADGDGYVTSAELHLLFVVAGFESAFCFRANDCPDPELDGVTLTWAHHTVLETPVQLDGKYLGAWSSPAAGSDYGGYAMIAERHGVSAANPTMATMGVAAHELGHDLGWPDLYDPTFLTEGVGMWSLMGSGMWNGTQRAGDLPALPDAFSRWYQGWISPTAAENGQSYGLLAASAGPGALLLGENPGGVDWDFLRHSGAGEYWLLENRQQSGYDAALPGCGILIWHIDETRSYDVDANVDPDRPLVGLVQADGRRDLNQEIPYGNDGDAGDPYPGTTGNREFSPRSVPRSRYYSGDLFGSTVAIEGADCAASMTVGVAEYVVPSIDQFHYLPVAQK